MTKRTIQMALNDFHEHENRSCSRKETNLMELNMHLMKC